MRRSASLVQCALAAPIGLLAGGGAPVVAQETTTGSSASIAEVNRILFDPSHTTPVRLTFRGVVTFVSRAGDICLQEDRDGVMIEPPSGSARPTLGDSIEARADVGFQSTDTSDPDLYLRTESIRKLGTAPLPEPEKPWLAEALVGKCSRRWVEVEGIVMQATLERGVVQALRNDPELATVPFVFLTAKSDRSDVRVGMNFGADDYLTKPVVRDDLLAAVQVRLARAQAAQDRLEQVAAQAGGFNPDYSSPDPLQRAFALTAREAEVLLWVAQGKSNGDIALILGMSEKTAKPHLGSVFQKIGVESRNAAALQAVEVLSRPRI